MVAAGGGGLVDGKGAAALMERACASVTCFVAADVRAVEVPVEGQTPLAVPFGADPTAAADAYLRNLVRQ